MRIGHLNPIYIDPVCGMEISRSTAVEEATYKGHRYFFCAKLCRETFEAEPERFVFDHSQAEEPKR